ncbi:hypothetical protein [Streptomyces sp. NPDC051567]|uniref:hypothetical protein n=1 Tax=Streptomyces sp. NPDC051567 TaxID=3365660 RepID=UPI00379BA5AC
MTKTVTADTRTTRSPRRPEHPEHLYRYRIRGNDRSTVLLWIGGPGDEPDQILTEPVADHPHVQAFVTARQARTYATRRGWKLADPATATLELTDVQHWLAAPAHRKPPPGAVLEAWNFFEDLARGLHTPHRLPQQTAVHNSAYEKLFAGEPGAWTPDEQHAVRELITAGVELWHTCPMTMNPRSSRTTA